MPKFNQLNLNKLFILFFFLFGTFYIPAKAAPQGKPTIEFQKNEIGIRTDIRKGAQKLDLLNKRIPIDQESKTIYSESFSNGKQGNYNIPDSLSIEKGINNIESDIESDNSLTFKCSGDLVNVRQNDDKKFIPIGEFAYMSINFAQGKEKYYMQLACKQSQEEDLENPEKNLGFEENQTEYGENQITPYHLSNNYNGKIPEDQIEGRLLQPNPDKQPTFTDIIYLQLKTIGNLTTSIKALSDNDFSEIFGIQHNYEEYLKWIDKFSQFSNKKSFVDSFSGAINLKDIGIGNDVILGLSQKLNCIYSGTNCDDIKVKIQKGYDKKHKFYKLKGIVEYIYNSSNSQPSIGDEFIDLYQNLRNIKNNLDGLSTEEKEMAESFLGEMFTGNISSLENDDINKYSIGYGLSVREDNLKKLKTYFQNNTGINLLGIYNFYFEINNLVKGTKNLSNFKKRKEEGNIQKFFQKDLPKLIVGEKTDLKSDFGGYNFDENNINSEILNILDKNKDTTIQKESNCYYYNTGIINTNKDKYTLLNGLISEGIEKNGENQVTLNLKNLKSTKYRNYVKNVCKKCDNEITNIYNNLYNRNPEPAGCDHRKNKFNNEDISSISCKYKAIEEGTNSSDEYDNCQSFYDNFSYYPKSDSCSGTSNKGYSPYAFNCVYKKIASAEYNSAGYVDMDNDNVSTSQGSITDNNYQIDDNEFEIIDNDRSLVEINNEKGLFIDNENNDDHLKYNLSNLSLGNSRAIEISVRGAALKRDDSNSYYLFHNKNGGDEFKLRLRDNKLGIGAKPSWNFDTKSIENNKFYSVKLTKEGDSGGEIMIKGNGIDLSTGYTISIPDLDELYVGNMYEDNNEIPGIPDKYKKQRNDIINFVRIYKKEDD